MSPALLARVQEELARPPGTLPSLLSHLPEDDGNGHDLAAAVRSGCDGSAPLRYGTVPGGPSVGVDRSGDQPRLVLVASVAMDVAFGDTRVGAARDWVFTSAPTAGGWQLTDATAESAVDWFPVP